METSVIFASNGAAVTVDAADLAELSRFRWHVVDGYACRQVRHPDGHKTWISMHRHLLGLGLGDECKVDHRNRRGLDNRRANLRPCTNQQNSMNHSHALGASGVRGVYACGRKWQAKIMVDGRVRHLGLFDTKDGAGEFRRLVAEMVHGEFAEHLNGEAA